MEAVAFCGEGLAGGAGGDEVVTAVLLEASLVGGGLVDAEGGVAFVGVFDDFALEEVVLGVGVAVVLAGEGEGLGVGELGLVGAVVDEEEGGLVWWLVGLLGLPCGEDEVEVGVVA